MSAEPCSTCQTAAWYRWMEKHILRGEPCPEKSPHICDPCRERLKRVAAQYQTKEPPS